MSPELVKLTAAAATIGLFHTLMGPDHYLPFVVLARARKWSLARTSVITLLCGLGHVASSILLGFVGIAAGVAAKKLGWIESFRGDVAAWLLTAFGLVYFAWGVRRAIRNRPHSHVHLHSDLDEHRHEHTHHAGHAHPHAKPGKVNLTPWVLFTIFIFGPCEPLIPLMMYPAAAESLWSTAMVAGVFAIVTISTMLTVVLVASFAAGRLPFGRFERYSHALAGATVTLCGVAIHLGL